MVEQGFPTQVELFADSLLFRKPIGPLEELPIPPEIPLPLEWRSAGSGWRKVNVQNSQRPELLWDIEPARYRPETFEHVRLIQGVLLSMFAHENNLSHSHSASQWF